LREEAKLHGEVQEELQEGPQEEESAVPDDMLQARLSRLKIHALYRAAQPPVQQKVRAAEQEGAKTRKEDRGFAGLAQPIGCVHIA